MHLELVGAPEVDDLPLLAVAGADGIVLTEPVPDVARGVRRAGLSAATAWYEAARHPVAIGLDALAVALAVLVAVPSSTGPALLALLVAGVAGLVFGLHKDRSRVETQGVGWAVRPVSLVVASVGLAAGALDGTDAGLQAAAGAAVALLGCRVILWAALGFARRRHRGGRATLVIASPAHAAQIAHRLVTFPESGLALAARVGAIGGAVPARAVVDTLDGLLARHRHLQVLVAVDCVTPELLRDLARRGEGRVDCAAVPPAGGIFGARLPHHLGDLGVVPLFGRRSGGTDLVKRVLDMVVSGLLLVVASPLLAAVALAVRLSDHGPAVFRQARVGRDGHVFEVLKFRSMVRDAEDQRSGLLDDNVGDGLLFKLENDPRVTRVGAILRRFSIDELPQLVNVVRGEMSLVGPRPLPVAPEEFDDSTAFRHAVLPGMTGPWQVHGSNAVPYGDMLDLDLTYVTGHTLGMDLKLLAMTVPALLVRRGVY